MNKKYLSKVIRGADTLYIKDAEARENIQNIQNTLTGAMHYIGTSTTAITDGLEMVSGTAGDGQAASITVDGIVYKKDTPGTSDSFVQLLAGDVVIYDQKEFVYNAVTSKWQEFGSSGSLKALAFKDTATGSFSVTGANAASAVSNFTGSETRALATTSITGTNGTETLHDTPTLNTTSVGSASAWDAGTMFSAAYTENTETLTLTAGTAPSLTITATTVGNSLTEGTAKTVAKVASSATIVATGKVAATDANGDSVVTASPTGATAAAQTFTGGTVSVTVS